MTSKNKFELYGNDQCLSIYNEGWNSLAFATVREDYLEEIQSITWTKNGDYLFNKKLGMYLHRYIIKKWYGEQMLENMTSKGFVIDHLNNDGFDCTIENLYFLHSDENKAKGFTVDKQSEEFRSKIALRMYRDFSTGYFQTTIFFNETVILKKDDKTCHISALRLLYDQDYKIAINDAKSILDSYQLYNQIIINKLNYCDIKIEPALIVELKSEEMNEGRSFVERNGEILLLLNENVRVWSIHFEKGWTPPADRE